jgi:pimeloyl-ACP methyl ester carboxylesterase
LKELRALTKWIRSTDFILEELNFDTVGRLDTFLAFAEQFVKNRKQQKKQTQTAEEVLALAISGWLQGNQSADPDKATALKLARARAVLLEYLQTDSERDRSKLLAAFKRSNELPLPIDVLAKLVRMLPPPFPAEAGELHTKVQTIKVEAPDSGGGSYLLQLPPDYHHQRSYPVLFLLHGGRDTAETTLQRFSEEAARHGFILAAPLWTGKNGVKAKGQPGVAKGNALVGDSLRDLRRRFNVDSDRVFLFGFQEGGTLAFDVGLGHPDLFAGVVPMCAPLCPFTQRMYWPNAQYLPFYIIEGGRNEPNAKNMRDLFENHWTRTPFACLYVEYKGRASEWFSEEVPKMLHWMSRKVRHAPTREMGRAQPGVGGLHEEFRSTRNADNRFYWLRAEGVASKHRSEHSVKQPSGSFMPATFQASFSVGNKSDKDGGANIWNQASVRVNGLEQVSLWITQDMMKDFKRPLLILVNGQKMEPMQLVEPSLETLLEELYQTGDRQRLFVAKIKIKTAN